MQDKKVFLHFNSDAVILFRGFNENRYRQGREENICRLVFMTEQAFFLNKAGSSLQNLSPN